MLGNWAMGRLNMVIVPTRTKTIEITMATMGRLMKNFDIGLPSLRLCGKWLGVHLHARTHLLHSLDDHAFALLQPFRNNPLRADTVADFDRTNAHFVLAVHNRHLIAALQLRHRALRDKQRVFLDPDGRADFAVAAGAQNISRIRKQRSNPNRARALIHLAVRKVECALMWIGGGVGQNQFEAQTLASRLASSLRREPFVPIEVLALADGEIDPDGIDGGHGGHRPAARIDQGTHLKLSLPSDAVDGCNETRKIEVDLGGFDGSLSRP